MSYTHGDEFGGHSYSYKSISSGEVEIYDHSKLVSKVDNYQEAREWIDDEYDKFIKSSSENKNDTEA